MNFYGENNSIESRLYGHKNVDTGGFLPFFLWLIGVPIVRFEKSGAYLDKHPCYKTSTNNELLQEQAMLLEKIAELKKF